MKERFERAGIPPKFANSSFGSFTVTRATAAPAAALLSEVESYVMEFPFSPDKPQGVIFIGPPGTGKSLLAISALKALIGKGFEGLYLDYGTLLQSIQNDWQSDVQEHANANSYQNALDAPLLLLDDLGARRRTNWVEDTITHIITHRYNQNLPLIATTNLPLRRRPSGAEQTADFTMTLEEAIGARSTSRLFEMCRIVETWGLPDHRCAVTATR